MERLPNIKYPEKNKGNAKMQAGYRHRQHRYLKADDFINYYPLIILLLINHFRAPGNKNGQRRQNNYKEKSQRPAKMAGKQDKQECRPMCQLYLEQEGPTPNQSLLPRPLLSFLFRPSDYSANIINHSKYRTIVLYHTFYESQVFSEKINQ